MANIEHGGSGGCSGHDHSCAAWALFSHTPVQGNRRVCLMEMQGARMCVCVCVCECLCVHMGVCICTCAHVQVRTCVCAGASRGWDCELIRPQSNLPLVRNPVRNLIHSENVHFREMQFACPTFCLALSVSGRDEMFGQAQRKLCRVATCARIVVLYRKWLGACAMSFAQRCRL